MGYKSRVSEIGDRVRDEPEVQFLLVVDFLAAGHTCDVDVADAVNIVAQGSRYVAIGDLGVVNIDRIFTRGELTRLHTSRPHAT